MNTRSRATESAAMRVLIGLEDARDVVAPRDWLDLCLDALVHIANVDGGVLVDADGRVLTSVGLRVGSAKLIARMLHAHEDDVSLQRAAGVLATIPCNPGARCAAFALCTAGDPRTSPDLGAVTAVTTPLFSMISSAHTATEEVA